MEYKRQNNGKNYNFIYQIIQMKKTTLEDELQPKPLVTPSSESSSQDPDGEHHKESLQTQELRA